MNMITIPLFYMIFKRSIHTKKIFSPSSLNHLAPPVWAEALAPSGVLNFPNSDKDRLIH